MPAANVEAVSTAITAFTPWMIFAPRRYKRSAQESNAVSTAVDLQIGAAQSANVFKGVVAASKGANTAIAEAFVGADEKIRQISNAATKSEKAVGIIGKIANFTMNNINKVIGIGEIIRVMFSDNKERDAIIGGAAFGTMVLCENATNNFIGRAKTKTVNGVMTTKSREALYKKNSFLKVQAENIEKALQDYAKTGKLMHNYVNYIPAVSKGILFACASIGGYQLGKTLGRNISDALGFREKAHNQAA